MFRYFPVIKGYLKRLSKWLLLLLIVTTGTGIYFLYEKEPKPIVTVPEPVTPKPVIKPKPVEQPKPEPVKKVTVKTPQPKPAPLAVPTAFMATDGEVDRVTLFWDPVDGATVYRIYRSVEGSKDFVKIAEVNQELYKDTTVEPLQGYFYQIEASDGTRVSKRSQKERGFAKMVTNRRIDATDGTRDDSIRVSWKKQPGATYTLYRSKKPNSQFVPVAKNLKKARYIDHDVPPCENFYYRVVTTYKGVTSEPSSWNSGYSRCSATMELFAGSSAMGAKDAKGATKSQFNRPVGLFWKAGELYIADSFNHRIRKIDREGRVITVAKRSQSGVAKQGADDFYRPTGIVVDSLGNIFVSEVDNHLIRKITPTGKSTIFAGNGEAGDKEGTGKKARFNKPYMLAIDGNDILYVTELGNRRIKSIDTFGKVKNFAGDGKAGKRDGSLLYARFEEPTGIAVHTDGTVYVADAKSNNIRKIVGKKRVVTLTGRGTAGYRDGKGVAAMFYHPRGLALDKKGNLYVADTGNHLIRIVTPKGVVKTLSLCNSGDTTVDENGVGRFFSPRGMAMGVEKRIYISDFHLHQIKSVQLP